MVITHPSAPQIWRCLTPTRRVSSCMWRHSSGCFPKASPWRPSRRWRRCPGQPRLMSTGWRQRSIMRFRPSNASLSRLGTPAPMVAMGALLGPIFGGRILQSSDPPVPVNTSVVLSNFKERLITIVYTSFLVCQQKTVKWKMLKE